MHFAHLHHGLVAAVAAAALAGQPAVAASSVFPGTLCTSEGAVEKSVTGLMLNKVAGPGFTYFHCPIIHSKPLGIAASSLGISVNVKTAANSFPFDCWVRSTKSNNVTFDSIKIPFPSNYNGDTYYTINGSQLSMPGVGHTIAPASVNMRCKVPNIIDSVEAGIVSYRVEW